MQYAEHLPNSRTMVAPVVALVIGAAAATGTWALLDSDKVEIQTPKVAVVDTPVQGSQGVAAKHEAATAAAIATRVPNASFGKDEAASAAAIATRVPNASFGKDEAASAAAIGPGVPSTGSDGVNAKNEAGTAAAIGNRIEFRGSKASSSGTGSATSESDEALRTDPHGNKSAFRGR